MKQSRREFMKLAGLGGLALTGVASCRPSGAPRVTMGSGRWHVAASELDEITVDRLQAGLASGQWTAEEITRNYLRRIEALDRSGPTLRAVIETNPDAIALARELDEERAGGRVRGPLHGIPVLVKDNVGTADRMTTTAGSLALEGSIPRSDSFVARRLRENGAIILGKANLSEWANFRSTNASSGWSGRGGQCRNPYALHRNPCGSSSGSGAAVSANLTPLAIGTETNGSIVCPSSACGVVGIKPTVGLWSRSVIIPISHTQDTAGPMTRTVRDGAILLGALTGVDSRDPATAASRGNAHSDYTQFLDPNGLQGARIGVVRDLFGFSDKVDALMEDALQAMRDAGATIVDEVAIPNQDRIGPRGFDVMLYEFKADLNAYLAALGPTAPIKTLEDAIRFNEEHRDREMRYFGQEIFELAQEKGPLTEQAYIDAVDAAQRFSGPEGIDAAMDQHAVDALVAPTGGPAWTTDLVNGDHYGGGSSSPAARSGYPNITVPAGYVMGLPVGMSFFGRRWSEPVLLRLTYAFEQATHHRTTPEFRTVDL
jgi:amidase